MQVYDTIECYDDIEMFVKELKKLSVDEELAQLIYLCFDVADFYYGPHETSREKKYNEQRVKDINNKLHIN